MTNDRSSPIADWVRPLQRSQDQRGVKGRVIGMCLTNFAIQLIGDDSVLAAVASQLSNAFFKQGELHMSSDDIEQSRNALDVKGPMRVLRFENVHCAHKKNPNACIVLLMMTAT